MSFESLYWRQCKAGAPFGYTSERRDIDYLEKAYGKIAYASAGGGGGLDTTWGIVNIPTPQIALAPKEETIYKLAKHTATGDEIYIPTAHLTNVKTTSDPENYGTVQKGSFSFKTYTKGQLDSLAGFFVPGTDITISFGWAYGGKGVGNPENFSGKVTNFNVQLNSEGGFDGTIEAVGGGSTTLAGLASNMTLPLAQTDVKDANGKSSTITDLYSALIACNTEAVNLPEGKAVFNNGIQGCVVEVPENYDSVDQTASTDNANKVKKAYVTVESIIMLLQKLLSTYTTVSISLAPDPYCKAPCPNIASSNPLEVLVPGNSTYGTKVYNTGGLPAAMDGSTVSFKNLLICCDKIAEDSKIQIADATDKKQRTLSIKSFLDKIFGICRENLGKTLSLSVTNSADESDKNLYIIDVNAINSGVTPVSIETVRSANLSAALDAETAAYFWAKAAFPGEKPGASAISGKPSAAQQAANLAKALQSVGDKCTPENVTALRAINNELAQGFLGSAKDVSINAPFQLSLTLDGTSGFRYGDVITTSHLPKSFTPANSKVGFFITQIEHNVQDGDWTTTLSTACKFYK